MGKNISSTVYTSTTPGEGVLKVFAISKDLLQHLLEQVMFHLFNAHDFVTP